MLLTTLALVSLVLLCGMVLFGEALVQTPDNTATELTTQPGAVRDTPGNLAVGTFDASAMTFVGAASVLQQDGLPQGNQLTDGIRTILDLIASTSLLGYAFAQSVTLNLTATYSITDTNSLELDGARDIATFESGGSTYAAVTAYVDDGVQILDITNPSSVTAVGNIADTNSLELDGAYDIATFESGGSTYAAVTAYDDDGVQILRLTAPINNNASQDFVTTWKTTVANESITIPATGTYMIDWGDGITSANVTGTQSHEYASAGNHTVRISGGLEAIQLGNNTTANAAKL